MDTIYSDLIKYRDLNFESLNTSLQSSISDKIVRLFERIIDVDYSHLRLKTSERLIGSRDGDISISFEFQDGWFTLKFQEPFKNSMADQFIDISLHFNKDFPIKHLWWEIITDGNLNLVQGNAIFSYIGFSKKNLGLSNNNFVHCNLRFCHIVDANKKYNQVSYQSTKTEKDIYFDLLPYGLNEIYTIQNDEFEKWLHIFLGCASEFPFSLSELFPHYPKYIDIIYDINQAVSLLNAFKQDYDTDFDQLKTKILLMEMFSI